MTHFTQLSFVMAALAAGCLATSAATFTTGGLQYETIDDATVTVKKYVEGTDVVIPSTVKDGDDIIYTVVSVSPTAFSNSAIKSVSIPATVKTVERNAFAHSTVETVTLAEGLETIGYGAFSLCEKLKEIKLPSTIKTLGAVWTLVGEGGYVFGDCPSLAKIEIPASVETLPMRTFQNCVCLTEVVLHEGLTTIAERAFENCPLLCSLTLPSTVTTIERAAFNKTGFTHPVVPGVIKIIPNSCYLWCSNMTGVTIEEGIVEVGRQAFADCALEAVEVPASVEWIRTDAFQGNGNVTTIRLGAGLRRLGHASLAVWVPSIEGNVPQWKLTDIYVDSPVPPVHEPNDDHFDVVDDDFFFGGKEFTDELRAQFYSEVKLHVPDDAVAAYRAADIWKEFDNINGVSATAEIAAEVGAPLTVNGTSVYGGNGHIEAFRLDGVRVAGVEGDVIDLSVFGSGVYVVKSGSAAVKAIVR